VLVLGRALSVVWLALFVVAGLAYDFSGATARVLLVVGIAVGALGLALQVRARQRSTAPRSSP
jgi:hypothetical protein